MHTSEFNEIQLFKSDVPHTSALSVLLHRTKFNLTFLCTYTLFRRTLPYFVRKLRTTPNHSNLILNTLRSSTCHSFRMFAKNSPLSVLLSSQQRASSTHLLRLCSLSLVIPLVRPSIQQKPQYRSCWLRENKFCFASREETFGIDTDLVSGSLHRKSPLLSAAAFLDSAPE